MTDDRPGVGGHDDEGRLRSRLRLLSAGVLLACIVFLVVVDALGRLLIRPDFHVGDIFLGSILGTLVVLLIGEGAARGIFPFGGPK